MPARTPAPGIKVEIGNLVTDSIRFTRALSFELSSPLAEYLPFGSAVQWLADEILTPSHVAVNVEVDGNPDFPAGDERALFILVLREVFVNIVKHAHAHRVDVSVRGGHDGIVVEVSDDGRGFDPSSTAVPASMGSPKFGLRAVSERMVQLQGVVSVRSTPGNGTSVSLTVPMPRRDHEASA